MEHNLNQQQQQSVIAMASAGTKVEEKPREKLQNQMDTIMPMEIVRAQPFFSRHSLILRDQLEEYVNGFPATKAHRQMIAKNYNLDTFEVTQAGDQVPITVAKKSKKRAAKKDEIDMLIPDQDLPVDPQRLKKAIKIALIKNGNNPDKIDIQSIMREQVRIHKNIQEFKSLKNPTKVAGSAQSSYFSSHIVKKIAEDHIHNSLKQIKTDDINRKQQGMPSLLEPKQ